MAITAFYTGILIIIGSVLAGMAGAGRGKNGLSIGWGDDLEFGARVRRHGNFTEHVPLTLIAMALIEAGGASTTLMHVLGVGLVLARIAHPIGLRHDNISHPLRAVGAAGTLLITLVAGGVAIWQFVG